MSQEAKCLNTDPVLGIGHVQAIFEDCYLVVAATGSLNPFALTRVKRATTCLIEPQLGDKILLMLAEDNQAYILHILEREESEAKLVLPSQTQICLVQDKHTGKVLVNNLEKTTHSLKINAENMEFNCTQNLSITSNEMTASAHKLNLGAHIMILTGQVFYSRFDSMRTACKHAVAKIHHYFGFYHKKIDHADDIIDMQSKRTTIKNTESLRIQNKNTHIRAENSVDMDGQNIRIG